MKRSKRVTENKGGRVLLSHIQMFATPKQKTQQKDKEEKK